MLLILLINFLSGTKWPFTSGAQTWRTGFVWLLLTGAWEFGFFRPVMGRPRPILLGGNAIWDGRLWPFMLAAILCAPFLSRAVNRTCP